MSVCVCVCVCVSVCLCVCLCLCEGGRRVMLVRYLSVLHVSFWCLELCLFLFNSLLYAPWAHLRRGAERPDYNYYYYYYFFISLKESIFVFFNISPTGME